ncbi:hypothetical protein GQF61_16105 [Sphingobacterium sp. DK4209]|uniref:Uncharacterized protein n=1 Tax=Sphingobacterium zhuxiongii TaxID=2662364 RepID=A0A5Q0QA51_9SPHI|nr:MULTISPECIES: right-handed parallel beta-helix repeat-containing protein [unclassified Sphingobacterium]MVZ67378.1 hypothetical protein [Sphingobacterium sp. DK4209]QGA26316.1 hypothetical protein GFH32_08235 [Sphingobacterium sp. dk4302]
MKLYRIKQVLVLLILAAFASCQKIDIKSFDAQAGEIAFDKSSLDAGNQLDTLEIALQSNLPYRLKTASNWITFVKANGLASDKVQIIVARNRELVDRTGIVEAYITDQVKTSLTIVQKAGEVSSETKHLYVKATATASTDGLSWEKATSLDQALKDAENGDVIHVAAGVYRPTVTLTGGSQAGDITFEIAQNIKLIGGYPSQASTGATADPINNKTELNGDDKAIHVLTILAPKTPGQKVEIDGFTLTKGKAGGTGTVPSNGLNISRQHGAGLLIAGSVVELKNMRITDNSSANHNPGVYLTAAADVIIRNSTISNNYCTIASSNGGGIWNDGSRLQLIDSEIVGNRIGGVGAGLYSLNTSVESVNILYNVTIANNVAGMFGANSVGGGIYAREKSQFYLINSTIHSNRAGGNGFGGGIAMYGASQMNLINSTVTANQGGMNNAGSGGSAIQNASAANNSLFIYNSIIAGNVSTGSPELGGNAFASYSIKSSTLGTQVYDYDGKLGTKTFDPQASFGTVGNHGAYGETVPLKGASAATTDGMTTLQLQILGVNLSAINADYLLIDQKNVSRNGKAIMGADISVK